MKIADEQASIDLTNVPYFVEPLTLPEGSSQERLRPASAPEDEVIVIPDYRVDRPPAPVDPGVRLGGGLGEAAVMDVAAHPIRARAHRINVLTIVAITIVVGVAMVMATLVVAFKP